MFFLFAVCCCCCCFFRCFFRCFFPSLQTFAIPGTLLLSILSGALFDSYLALFFVTLCSSTGASLCYGLSNYLAFNLVNKTFPKQLESFRQRIHSQKSNIFFYLLFLRLTPLLPNWFINLASPIIDIKFIYFLFATMFGLIPANWIYVNMGKTVTKISNDSMKSGMIVLDYTTMAGLFTLALVSLIPIVIKNYCIKQEKEKNNDKDKEKETEIQTQANTQTTPTGSQSKSESKSNSTCNSDSNSNSITNSISNSNTDETTIDQNKKTIGKINANEEKEKTKTKTKTKTGDINIDSNTKNTKTQSTQNIRQRRNDVTTRDHDDER